MEQHVKILGVLHIVFGSLGLLLALGLLVLFGGIAGLIGASDYSGDAHISIPILGGIGAFVFFVLLVLSLPGLIKNEIQHIRNPRIVQHYRYRMIPVNARRLQFVPTHENLIPRDVPDEVDCLSERN